MNSIDKAGGGNVRLWAVRRKEELHRPRPTVQQARQRRVRARATASDREQALTDAELELALRHFDDQRLDPEEAGSLSSAILYVIYRGGTRGVGPVGRRRRHYVVSRQTDGISLRAGEGRILLPLTCARRLAGRIGKSGSAGTLQVCA